MIIVLFKIKKLKKTQNIIIFFIYKKNTFKSTKFYIEFKISIFIKCN